jgi:hypothetical protein
MGLILWLWRKEVCTYSLFSFYSGSIQPLLRPIQPLLRLCSACITTLLRMYPDKTLFSIYSGSVQALFSLYSGYQRGWSRGLEDACAGSIRSETFFVSETRKSATSLGNPKERDMAIRNRYFYNNNYSQAWPLVTRFIKALFMRLYSPLINALTTHNRRCGR